MTDFPPNTFFLLKEELVGIPSEFLSESDKILKMLDIPLVRKERQILIAFLPAPELYFHIKKILVGGFKMANVEYPQECCSNLTLRYIVDKLVAMDLSSQKIESILKCGLNADCLSYWA